MNMCCKHSQEHSIWLISIIAVIAVLSFISTIVDIGKVYCSGLSISNSLRQNASDPTGATGKLFSGEKFRIYKRKHQLSQTQLPRDRSFYCHKWAVVTTIFEPSEPVKNQAQIKGWCLVIVLDKKSPQFSDPAFHKPEVVILTVEKQISLAKEIPFIAELPWNHFGRKNVGYAYAIMHGAKFIWDFDDDNGLTPEALRRSGGAHPFDAFFSEGRSHINVSAPPESNCLAPNILPLFKPSNQSRIWPRGHPLENLNDPACQVNVCAMHNMKLPIERVGVILSLADHDPDVDALYRLTRELPVVFESQEFLVAIPNGKFASYNAQSTFFTKGMFWSLYLPISVHGRVSDIWRAYFSQRLARLIGMTLVYSSSQVEQIRNSHNYLADLNSEVPLYERSGVLLRVLDLWKPTENATFFEAVEDLWIDMYERGFIEAEDVNLIQLWLDFLKAAGFSVPRKSNPIHDTASRQQQAVHCA
jgi:hypothetical protein